ncbi:MAG: hypothetical protein ABIO44_09160, partial [Saprospiraceae bacterium]
MILKTMNLPRYYILITTYLLVNLIQAQNEIDIKSLDQQVNDEATNINLSNEISDDNFLKGPTTNLIDINSLEKKDLEKLSFLSELDRQLIYTYVLKHKPLISILELQSIIGIDPDKIRSLLPLFKVKGNTESIFKNEKLIWKSLYSRISL